MKMFTVCRLHPENAYSVQVTTWKVSKIAWHCSFKGNVWRDILPLFEPIWAPDKQFNIFSNLIIKFKNPTPWVHGVHCFKVSLIFSANRRCEPVPNAYRPKHFGIFFTPICWVFSVPNSVHRNFPTCLPNYFGHLKSIASKKRTISKNSQLISCRLYLRNKTIMWKSFSRNQESNL